MSFPKISVAIATYNGALYIKEQLTSILRQVDNNAEIIISDDGSTDATNEIQVDRFSAKSNDAAIDFLDTMNRFLGWKTVLAKPNAWIQYNTVQFGNKPLKSVAVKAVSGTGATLVIRTKDASGPIVAEVTIPKGSKWSTVKKTIPALQSGIKNLVVQLKGDGNAEVDWISFQ